MKFIGFTSTLSWPYDHLRNVFPTQKSISHFAETKKAINKFFHILSMSFAPGKKAKRKKTGINWSQDVVTWEKCFKKSFNQRKKKNRGDSVMFLLFIVTIISRSLSISHRIHNFSHASMNSLFLRQIYYPTLPTAC